MILISAFLKICGLSCMDRCVIDYEILQQSTHEEGVLIESHYHANHCQHWPCIARQWYAILLHVYIKSSMNLLHTVNIILFVVFFCFRKIGAFILTPYWKKTHTFPSILPRWKHFLRRNNCNKNNNVRNEMFSSQVFTHKWQISSS